MKYTNIKEVKENRIITLYANVNENKESEIIFQSPFESDLENFLKENCILWCGDYYQVPFDKYPFE